MSRERSAKVGPLVRDAQEVVAACDWVDQQLNLKIQNGKLGKAVSIWLYEDWFSPSINSENRGQARNILIIVVAKSPLSG